jgi:hypothetical protein
MRKGLSVFFVCLFLLSFLGEALHHHDDGADHPDCSICVATHLKSDTGITFSPFEIYREFTETVDTLPILPVASKTLFTPSLGRAPPA